MAKKFGGIRKTSAGNYQAYYQGLDGRRHYAPTGTFTNRRNAEAWLRDEQILIEQQRWTPPKQRFKQLWAARVNVPTVGEAVSQILESRARGTDGKPPLRVVSYKSNAWAIANHLDPLTDLLVTEVTREMVEAWVKAVPASKPRLVAYNYLKAAFNDLVDREVLESNPVRVRYPAMPTARKGRALTRQELETYLKHVPDNFYWLFVFLSWCSLRSGEARALRRECVDDAGRFVEVKATVSGVGKSEVIADPKTKAGFRVVAVPPHLQPGLAEWLADWDLDNPGGGLLWHRVARPKVPVSYYVLARLNAGITRVIGLDGVRLHDLRRTGASLAGAAGATVKELMNRLGHANPGVAMLYQVADFERDRALAERMSGLG